MKSIKSKYQYNNWSILYIINFTSKEFLEDSQICNLPGVNCVEKGMFYKPV